MTSQIGHLSKGVQDVDPERTWAEYRTIIEAAIAGHERSLQTRIGPSGVGTPCDRCLAHMLAGTKERRAPASQWLPTIGTAVHGWLADVFISANKGLPAGMVRYLVEQTVDVGEINGVHITGHADLFDLWAGEVTDWKITGDNTIKKTKANGPAQEYRYQGHLYGRGYQRRGVAVNRVRIAFLPRNSPSLRGAHVWTEPYDEAVAIEALERADRIMRNIAAEGLDATVEPMPPHTGDFSCARYESAAQQTPNAFLAIG